MELAKMIYFAMDESANSGESFGCEGAMYHEVHRQRFVFGMVGRIVLHNPVDERDIQTTRSDIGGQQDARRRLAELEEEKRILQAKKA